MLALAAPSLIGGVVGAMLRNQGIGMTLTMTRIDAAAAKQNFWSTLFSRGS